MNSIAINNAVTSAITTAVRKFTPQLFDIKNLQSRLPPKAWGTSILIKKNRRHFMITAAHCIDGKSPNHVGFMVENTFFTIGGNGYVVEPNRDEFNPNNMDIAVYELELNVVNTLKTKYDFLDWSMVNSTQYSGIPSKYVIFGYPYTKTRINFPTKEIIPKPLEIRTIEVSREYYISEKINTNKTIVLELNQLLVSEGTEMQVFPLPELGGISGCGVWKVLNLNPENPEYKLAGVITGEGDNKMVLYCSSIRNAQIILENHFTF